MTTITREQLENIAYEAGIDENIRTDYSGRGMHGKTCVAFIVDFDIPSALLSLGAAILTELGTDMLEAFIRDARTDNLGLGTVIYFPGITSDN